MKATILLFIALCTCTEITSRELSQKEAESIAGDIFSQSADHVINDAQAIANIIGSIIIREIKDNDPDRAISEAKKQNVTQAISYIAELILEHVRKKKARKNSRCAFLFEQEQLVIDSIAAKLVEITTHEN
jgi:hypothetical protein